VREHRGVGRDCRIGLGTLVCGYATACGRRTERAINDGRARLCGGWTGNPGPGLHVTWTAEITSSTQARKIKVDKVGRSHLTNQTIVLNRFTLIPAHT
jgi:hypothetical protein